MATIDASIATARPARRADWLGQSATFCYLAIAAGQLLFIAFILLFYYPPTLTGNFAAWNDKPLIIGFVAGDSAGNLFFAAHVLMAAVITFGGLVQLLPAIRNRWPALHRWNGRLYMLCALALALGGLWMTWGRGTWLALGGAIGITLDALLIIGFAVMTFGAARARRFADHRRWAIRLFAVASAVWFMRVGYMAWGLATGGAGIGEAMDGPFDLFLAFANSLLPLAVAEIYLRVGARGTAAARNRVAALLTFSGLVILAGSAGAWMVMWGPYI
ncbi:DUF2306 domain-containing protein [Sphingopyxis witflariensis]|uniref:DUF2306 domain-containing protein n=1 Tax=Sphingopyxis witflariensis TaxID=173675 RepID=A0A246JJ90_9SPHN|nr:DUF2306 domain-containing protein [Sphingopyxis witflariensis]OWQ92677.1 hypothetical protein CDQ91_17575 [Sphingopyxis witflariensis]